MNYKHAQELMDDEDPFDQLSSSPSINEEEIDFHYVYALKNFFATEQGQANAHKGDAMILLNDANSYWWLVRLVKDSSVGFLPAEHIETPWERLARLNKHRNGDMCAADAALGAAQQSKGLGKLLKNNRKKQHNKSVNFATSFTYFSASEYEYDDEADDEDSSEDEEVQDRASSVEATTTTTTTSSSINTDVVEEKLMHSHESDESRSPPPKLRAKSEKVAHKKPNGLFGLMSKMSRNNSQIVGEDLGAQLLAEPDALTTPDDDRERAKRRSLLKSKSSVEQIQVKKKKEALKVATSPVDALVPTPSIDSNDSSSSAQSQTITNASGFNIFKRRKSREQLSPVDTRFNTPGLRTVQENQHGSSAQRSEIPVHVSNTLPESREKVDDNQNVAASTDAARPVQRANPPPLVTSTIKPLRLGNNLQDSKLRQRARPQSAIAPSYGERALFPVGGITHNAMRNVSMQSQDSALTMNSIQSESEFQVSSPVAKAGAGQRYPNSRHPYDNYLQLPSRQRLPLPRVQNRQLLTKRQSVPAFHSSMLDDDEMDNQSHRDGPLSASIDDWTRESMWNTKRRSNIDVDDTIVYLSHIGLDSTQAKSILESHDSSTPPLNVAKPREAIDDEQVGVNKPARSSTLPLWSGSVPREGKSLVESPATIEEKSNENLHVDDPPITPAPLQTVESTADDATVMPDKPISMDVDETHDSSRDLEELVNDPQLKINGPVLTDLGREDDSDIIITSTRNVELSSRRETTQSWVTEQSHNLMESIRSYSSQSQQSDSVDSIPTSAASLSTLPTPVTVGNGSERSHSSQSTVSMSYFDRDNESPSTEQEDASSGLQKLAAVKEARYYSPNPSLGSTAPNESLVAPSQKVSIASEDYLHPDIVPLFKDTRDRLGILSNKLDALLQSYHR